MDEAFDQWERQKNAQDYHLYFAEWWQRDVGAMVLRDRNHPSVIMWSIGNEIPERAAAPGVEIARQLAEHIKTLDPTRPDHGRDQRRARRRRGARSRVPVPGRRRLQLPRQPVRARPRPPSGAGDPGHRVVPAGGRIASWGPVEKHPYVIGDFVWTGMDHLGESSIGNAQLNARHGRGAAGTAAPRGCRRARPPRHGAARARLPAGRSAPGGGRLDSISLPFPWFNCYCGDIDLIGQAEAAVVPPAGVLGAQQARDGASSGPCPKAARRSSARGAGPTRCGAGRGPAARARP